MISRIESISIIGAGNMGGALAKGLSKSECMKNLKICVSNPHTPKLDALKKECPNLTVTTDNVEACKDADLVVIAVKPWIVNDVLAELQGHIDGEKQIVASMVGGLSLEELDNLLSALGINAPLATIIPNTAIAVGESMTFISTLRTPESIDSQLVEIFNAVGKTMLVDERFVNPGMALASCGIAFAMRYVRASVEGGVQLGMRPSDALEAVLQTIKGAAILLQETGEHPEVAIDKVTTAGGITIKGLNAMEEAGFSGSVIKGLKSATPR